MIYKQTPAEAFGDYGQKASLIDFSHGGLNKVASLQTHIPEKLVHAIKEIEKTADPNFAYLYDRALGAGEVYGANNNGDWFGRQELISRHDTFEKCAHLFRHHQNKDPNNKIGDVMASAYNDELDTVDLIVKAPLEKIAKDLQKLEDGGAIATSMGAKVKFDECSICGNRAPSRAMYCDHLKYHMLKTYPDGRQVFARNPHPRFIDISFVIIPADPASTVLRKIASLQKESDIEKKDIGFSTDGGEKRDALHPSMIEATNHLDRGTALQTLTASRGPLRPDEFQAVLRKDASCIRFDIIPVVQYRMTEKVAMAGYPVHQLVNILDDIAGVPLQKKAGIEIADFMTSDEKHAYLQYRNSLPNFSKDFLR